MCELGWSRELSAELSMFFSVKFTELDDLEAPALWEKHAGLISLVVCVKATWRKAKRRRAVRGEVARHRIS